MADDGKIYYGSGARLDNKGQIMLNWYEHDDSN